MATEFQQATQPLPFGWASKYDSTRARYYFINHSTKETTWDDPRAKTANYEVNNQQNYEMTLVQAQAPMPIEQQQDPSTTGFAYGVDKSLTGSQNKVEQQLKIRPKLQTVPTIAQKNDAENDNIAVKEKIQLIQELKEKYNFPDTIIIATLDSCEYSKPIADRLLKHMRFGRGSDGQSSSSTSTATASYIGASHTPTSYSYTTSSNASSIADQMKAKEDERKKADAAKAAAREKERIKVKPFRAAARKDDRTIADQAGAATREDNRKKTEAARAVAKNKEKNKKDAASAAARDEQMKKADAARTAAREDVIRKENRARVKARIYERGAAEASKSFNPSNNIAITSGRSSWSTSKSSASTSRSSSPANSSRPSSGTSQSPTRIVNRASALKSMNIISSVSTQSDRVKLNRGPNPHLLMKHSNLAVGGNKTLAKGPQRNLANGPRQQSCKTNIARGADRSLVRGADRSLVCGADHFLVRGPRAVLC